MHASEGDPSHRFSLIRGGLVYGLERRLGLVSEGSLAVGRRALIFTALAWLPLIVLAAAQGLALGGTAQIPLLLDLGAWARFAIAIPILVIAEAVVDRRLAIGVEHLVSSGLVPESRRADLDAALAQATRGRDSWLAEVVMLALAAAGAWIAVAHGVERGLTDWPTLGTPPRPSLAGLWAIMVSLPIFQFLSLRWMWRVFLWARLLRRVAGLDLEIHPAHPDRAGGIGFFAEAQSALFMLSAPFSVVVSARVAMGVLHTGEDVRALQGPVIALIGLAALVMIGPLMAFTPVLVRAKRRGVLEYGRLGSTYARGFDRKWLRGGAAADEPLLGSPDIQSLADLGGSFEVVENMRTIPLERRHLIGFAIVTVAPMLPMLSFVVPMKEILTKLLTILAGTV